MDDESRLPGRRQLLVLDPQPLVHERARRRVLQVRLLVGLEALLRREGGEGGFVEA